MVMVVVMPFPTASGFCTQRERERENVAFISELRFCAASNTPGFSSDYYRERYSLYM